jgi:hypothetical protein
MLRKAIPDMAEIRGKLKWERRTKNRRGNAGPSNCGRLTRKCWYRGCIPCCARLAEFELYKKLFKGVTTGFRKSWENANSPGV